MVLISSSSSSTCNEWTPTNKNKQIDEQEDWEKYNNIMGPSRIIMDHQKLVTISQQEEKKKKKNCNNEEGEGLTIIRCPRCDSSNTKFCYYNNYSLSQPRHFCKACKRYWTRGGTLRNVPVGGCFRKNNNKRLKTSSSSSNNNNNITTNNNINATNNIHQDLISSTSNPQFYGMMNDNMMNFPLLRYDDRGREMNYNGVGLGFSSTGSIHNNLERILGSYDDGSIIDMKGGGGGGGGGGAGAGAGAGDRFGKEVVKMEDDEEGQFRNIDNNWTYNQKIALLPTSSSHSDFLWATQPNNNLAPWLHSSYNNSNYNNYNYNLTPFPSII